MQQHVKNHTHRFFTHRLTYGAKKEKREEEKKEEEVTSWQFLFQQRQKNPRSAKGFVS
jgi:hypothetical protein